MLSYDYHGEVLPPLYTKVYAPAPDWPPYALLEWTHCMEESKILTHCLFINIDLNAFKG